MIQITDQNKKEFLCRKCLKFLDIKDLTDGKCPDCETDEYIYINNK
jgi:Zn finger protein HypA/HybF involved in hydrogenase expression